jgi:hypothetical protein
LYYWEEMQEKIAEVNITKANVTTGRATLGLIEHFFLKDPIYLQSVIIHSANGGKGEGWHVEEYSVALLC